VRIVDDVISVIKGSIELWPTLVEIAFFQKARHGLPQLLVRNQAAGGRREAMACGTPVIAWRRGSVPEVVEEGISGRIVDNVDDAVRAVHDIDRLSREACRRAFEQRFDARRMAMDYLEVYRGVVPAG